MNSPLTSEMLVNSIVVGNQTQPKVTTLTDGSYVVTWQSVAQDGSGNSIIAQRFTAAGERIGNEVIVNSNHRSEQLDPSVAATEDGGFVIVWEGINQDAPGSFDYGVFGQRFDANGLPAGDEFQVNVTNTSATQFDPDVTGLPGGGFAVTFIDDFGDGSSDGISVRFYDAAGLPAGPDFVVNSEINGNQTTPVIGSIAPSAGANGLAAGGVVVTWVSPTSGTTGDGSGQGVFAQLFTPDGTPIGGEFQVNTTSTNNQTVPQVTGLDGGRFVITWTDDNGTDGSGNGIFAQIYEGDGTAVGTEFQVNVETQSTQFQPDITATTDGGFVVTWTSSTSGTAGDGSGQGVFGRRFDMDGTPTSGEFQINEEISSTQSNSAVSALPNGDFVAVWESVTSATAGDGSGQGVFHRVFGDEMTFTPPSARPAIEAFSTTRTFSEDDLNAAPQRLDADGAAAVGDLDSTDFDGGRLILSLIQKFEVEDGFGAQDAEEQFVYGIDTSGPVTVTGSDVFVNGVQIGTITQDGTAGAALDIALNSNADAGSVEILVEHLTLQNLSDDPMSRAILSLTLEDGDGSASEPVLIDVSITADQDGDSAFGAERQVNTVAVNRQDDSAIATLADGGYISVWTSLNQDNTGDNDFGVFAQRYDANGNAVGSEFQVNTTVTATQFDASVAGLNDGGWVIVWFDDNGSGIKLNRYDAAGTLTETETQVETESSASQSQPRVDALDNGGYVVSWTSQNSGAAGDGSSNGVFAQLFNAAGARVGGEISVNQQTLNAQDTSEISALSGGRFVVVWEENDAAGGDGSSSSVMARLFNDDGTAAGNEFQVNTFTSGAQDSPRVATLANGDFIVAYRSSGLDTSGGGVFYQRFTDAGVALEGEIRVNESVNGEQSRPDIIALDTGGFVIAWTNSSSPAPGSGADIYVQVFDADGTRIDNEVLINSEVSGTQDEVALTALPGGNYVVQWTSQTSLTAGDGNGDGIFQQIISDPAEISQSAAPVLSGLPLTVSLDEDDANVGTLLVAEGGLTLIDPDSADLDGGSIRIARIVAEPLQDQFNAPDDGTQDSIFVAAGGAITIAGSTIRVNGVDVATITSDGLNGAELVLDLLPGATPLAVEALFNALTYQNSSDDAREARTYSITINDGDGGLTQPLSLEIRVNQVDEPGGPQRVGDEDQINSFTAGNQADQHVATLNDGGWVVVWTSPDQDGSGSGVYQQRYSSDGDPIGGEQRVNDTTISEQLDAVTTGLADGGWIVVWEAFGQDSPSDYGIISQRYAADGSLAGGETIVNITPTSTQFDPDVATIAAGTPGFPAGGYVVVYTSDVADANNDSVVMQRFATDGTPVGGEQTVNTTTIGPQDSADVAVLNDGRIVVTFESGGDVFARVFNPDGSEAIAEFQLNGAGLGGTAPVVSATANGGFVIAWVDGSGLDGSGSGVVAQRFDATGAAAGDVFVVNEITSSTQSEPDVIGLDDGRFIIAWRDFSNASLTDGSSDAVLAQVYTAAGARIDNPIVLNTTTSLNQFSPELAALPGGNFVATYGSDTSGTVSGDGSGQGLFQQVYGDPADFGVASVPVLQGLTNQVTFTEVDVNAGFVRLEADKTVALGDTGAADFNGGSITLSVDFNADLLGQLNAGDDEVQNLVGLVSGDVGNGDVQFSGLGIGDTVSVDGVVVGTISATGQVFTIDFNAASRVESVEAVLGNLAYSNSSDAPNDAIRLALNVQNGAGQSIPTEFIDVTIVPELDSGLVGRAESVVNSFTPNDQNDPQIVELAGGGFVVVWTSSGQDTLNTEFNTGVYAQVYSAAGVPMGRELLINSTLPSSQNSPSVAAMDDGGFIVVWTGRNQDVPAANDFGIIGRLFDATGAPQSGELVLNTTTVASQFDPSVASLGAAGFVVTYTSDSGDGSSDAILSQRYDASGVAVGAETLVNTVSVSGNQSFSQVAALVDGGGAPDGYVVIFTAPTSGGDGDGDDSGTFGQRFDVNGAAVGTEFQINTNTDFDQFQGTVAGLSGGGFVVAWTDDTLDGSSTGVFAQRYDVNGVAVGDEFRVNTDRISAESQPNITAMSDGGFVVSWTASSSQDGSSDGVFGQRFAADGSRIDSEFQINEEISSNQNASAITSFGDGFAVVWRGETSSGSGDGSSGGISLRMFEPVSPIDTSPVMNDLDITITFFADDIIATPQVIDNAIAFSDPTGGSFAGGQVEVFFNAGATATDQLSVITDAVVGVAGSDVSVNGTVIGTIDVTENGANGAALVINLNASADAPSIQLLLEHMGYSSTDIATNLQFTSRSIAFVVTDGAGGQTQPDAVSISINAGTDTTTGLTLGDWLQPETTESTNVSFSDVTLLESDLIAGPIVIDANVDLNDFAGTTFDGGRLTVSEVFNAVVSQQLSVQGQGTGAGQIGFDGTTVTFEGTAIGTIDASLDGVNGTGLQINLNAAATREGVEALAEALTFGLNGGANSTTIGFDLTIVNGAGDSTGFSRGRIDVVRDVSTFDDDLSQESQVNTFTSGEQQSARVADLSDGGYVVVWTSRQQDNPQSSERGLFAQLYNDQGQNVGIEFQVNDVAFGDQFQPRVDGLSNGNFVVLWTESNGRDGSGQGVFGRIFQNDGTAVGAGFQVNDEISSTQNQAQVVDLGGGRFMTVWSSTTSGTAGDGSSTGIFARTFDANGVPEAGEFQVNSFTTSSQQRSRAIELPDGSVMVVWEDNGGSDGSGVGISAQRIANNGSLVSFDGTTPGADEQIINTTTLNTQNRPGVGALEASATLPNGGFIFVWQGQDASGVGIVGQIYDINGVAQGGEFQVNTLVNNTQSDPVVVGTSDGGFVVAWSDDSSLDGSGVGVFAQRFLADGTTDGLPFQLNEEFSSTQNQPELAVLLNGALVATWTSRTSSTAGDGSGNGVFQALFDQPALPAGAMAPVLDGVDDQLTFGENEVNAAPQLLNQDGALSLTDMDSANMDGGRILVEGLFIDDILSGVLRGPNDGTAQDILSILDGDGVTVSGNQVLVNGLAVGTIVQDGTAGTALEIALSGANATPENVEAILQRIAFSNSSDAPIPTRQIAIQVEDGDGGSTGSNLVEITITPEQDNDVVAQGDEEQVNTFTTGSQSDSATAEIFNAAGQQIGYVVVWQSQNQDRVQDNDAGIFGQRYDLNGDPVGSEFLVNDHTEFSQSDPSVTGLPTGGFVVGWTNNSFGHPSGLPFGETSTGVFARAFDEDGAPIGTDFLVNDITPGTQYEVALAAKSDSTIIAVYTDTNSADGSGSGVFMRQFDASGTPLGASTQVNVETLSTQSNGEVTVLDGGRIVVTWASETSGTAGDGSGTGVFGRVFEADGTAVGTEFQVNTTTNTTQNDANVASLNDGGFIVVWQDGSGADGSGVGIFQQRFDANGAAIGNEILVNTVTLSTQADPYVIGLPGGGWVVAWRDDSGSDGSGGGVFGQRFTAAGSRIDDAFQTNTEFSSTQSEPRLVNIGNDGFAAIWSSTTSSTAGDGNGFGVFQQIFAADGDVVVSDAPILTGLPTSITLDEADLNADGALFAATAGLGDADSADFAGGRLIVGMVFNDVIQSQFVSPDDGSQDQLSFDTLGVVSLSGTDVLVSGTVVGTLVSDGVDGATLEVVLNANADSTTVQALIRSLSYGNSSDDPELQRQISVQVTDGDGGVVSDVVQIDITPEVDGAVVIGDEVQTNSFTTGAQTNSHVATLADGGYVIVWRSTNQDATGDGNTGVFAQRYDASGAPVSGEFQANTVAASAQENAQVVGLSTGGFVIVWEDFSGLNGDDGTLEIVYQVYDAAGQTVGSETAIDNPSNNNPREPSIEAFDNGDFAIVYHARDNVSFVDEIRVQRFNDQGGQIGSEASIVPLGASGSFSPDMAVQTDGTYVVVFDAGNLDNPGDNDLGVFMQRFAADDSLIGGPIQVNTRELGAQDNPRVAATEDGGYVVVYNSNRGDDFTYTTSFGVYAQRFDGAGNRVGEEFLVNEVVDSSQFAPDVVSIAGSGGGFAVVYTDSNGSDGSGSGVFLQQYDAQANRIDGAVQVNQEVSSTQELGAIAALAGGNVVVSFSSATSATAGDGSSTGVFHRLLGDPDDFAVGGAPVLEGINREVTYAENTLNGVPQLIDQNGSVAVSDPDSADFDGGSILVSNVISSAPLINQINSPDDLTQDQLGIRQDARVTLSGNDVSVDGVTVGQIAQDGQDGRPFELTLNANADAAIVELLVEHLTYRNISDDPLEVRELRIQVTDGDGGASAPALVTINIDPTPDGATPVGGEQIVNTTMNGEDNPAVATLPGTDGDFVVVWESTSTDGSGEGIFAQRFDANGNKLARDGSGLASGDSDEFQVNTTTIQDQRIPDIAAFSDGSWIVTWVDDTLDGSGQGIAFQRFNADGTPAGAETVANDLGSSTQTNARVAVLDNDDFVITWDSANSAGAGDGSSTGVIARQFASDGTPAGGQFVVNTEFLSEQSDPSITQLEDGGYFITWRSFAQSGSADGDNYGVFGQRYAADGTAVGTEVQINTSTRNGQSEAEVTVLADGNLAVTWTDNVADLSGGGIYATIIAPDGTPVAQEFRVNDQRISTQNDPAIASLDTGGFVIAWVDFNGTDGSGQGVFAQQYDASGARIDSQFQVNTTFIGSQNQPDIAGLPGGGFVVTWNGSVLIQIYGNEAPSISPVSASGDEDTGIALDAAIFDAGFTDPDGNTLAEIRIETFPTNGTLTLSGVPVVAGQIVSRADLLAGNLVYTGNQDFNGSDSFLWTGSDGLSFSNDPAVAADITVNPVNDAPGLEAGADTNIGEGQALNRTITLSDPDTDSRSFTIDYGDGSPVETFDTTSLTPSLTHSYAGEGTFTVTVTVDDNAGDANSVETDTFEVTVVNADPFAINETVTVSEDANSQTGNVLTNDSDPGGDPLTVSSVNGQPADVGVQITLASGALFTLNADGSFDYDPNGQFETLADFQIFDDQIDYEVSDGEGGTDNATLTMRVDGQNDAPDAQNDDIGVNDDSTVTGNVLDDNGNGADTDIDNSNVLTITELNGQAGDVGSQITLGSGALVTLNADGTFDYDPNGAFPGGGSDSFDYTVSDGRGGTDTATVNVSINATNVAPVAQDDSIAASENAVATGSVLTDNGNGVDSDANGDPLTVTEVDGVQGNVGNAVTLAGGGLLTVNSDGSYSFDPNGQYEALAAGQTTTETFTYTIEDGAGGSDTATATITITGENDAPVGVNDTATTDENSTTTGNVLTNDTDVDTGDVLSVSEVGGSALAVGVATPTSGGGSITIEADGSFIYDPGTAFDFLAVGTSTTDSVTYTVADGNGGSDINNTLLITVNGLNDAPTAEDDAFNVGEDNILSADLTADNGNGADSDPDTGDIPFLTEVNGSAADIGQQITLASGALLTVNGSGTFTYDANGQFNGLQNGETDTDSFTYTLSDGNGGTDTATVSLTIIGNNDSPVAVADSATTDEDSSTSGNVLTNDIDADGDTLSVTEINGETGDIGTLIQLASGALVTMNSDGSFDYDTNGQFDGLAVGESTTDSFDYTVSDGNSGSDTTTVTITIDGVNDAPVAQDDTFATDEETALNTLDLFANNGGGLDLDPDTSDLIQVIAVDGSAGNVGNQFTLASGALVTVNADGSASYDPNGGLEFLGVGDTATDQFSYTFSDGNGGTDTATVRIFVDGVNDAPDAMDDILNVAVDAALSGNVLIDNGNGADSDIDASDTLSVTALNGAPAALGVATTLASGAIVTLNADGTFDYDQNGVFSGLGMGATATDSFEYSISDGNGGFDTATATITIGGTNIPPVAIDDGFATDEDNGFTTGSVLTNDMDANGDALSVVALDTSGTTGLVTDNGDGTFDYNPNGQFEDLRPGQSATDTFTYTVGDGNGGTDTATVTITINGVNDAPVAVDDVLTVNEDAAGSVVVTLNDTDIEGTDLEVDSIDTTGVSGSVTIDLDNDTISYDPNGQFEFLAVGETATETFTYTVIDEDGGTDTATVVVTVEGRNDAPVAADDALTTDEDNATSGNVLADNGAGADSDVDLSDTLSVSEVNGNAAGVGTQVSLPSGALLTLNGDGTFDYDPNGQFESLAVGENTTDSFTYTISDGNGGTSAATVTMTIDGVNDAPVAEDDGFTTDEDNATSGNVLADNGAGADSDVDQSDILAVSAVNGEAGDVGAQVTLASGALLTLNGDGTFDYDPNGAFEALAVGESGTDGFSYTVSDGNGGTDTADVTITVNGVNDAPTATDDADSTDEDTAIISGTVLGNDTDPDSSDVLSVTEVNGSAADVGTQITLGSGALLTLNSDGTYDYDPNGQFEALAVGETATDSFTYMISDGNGGTDTATATITIDGANDAPDAMDDILNVAVDAALNGNVLNDNGNGADSDVDASDTLNVTALNGVPAAVGIATALASGAIVTLNADGTFAYDQNGAFSGLGMGNTATDGFDYTISDGNGGFDTASVSITIGGSNQAPVGVDDDFATNEDTAFTTGSVLINDTDGNGDTLSVLSVDTSGTIGLVTDNGDGTFDYDPNGAFETLGAGQSATDMFSYTVSDGNGGTDTATVSVTINGVNDAPVAVDDTASTDEDTSIIGNLITGAGGLSEDTDVEDDALNVIELRDSNDAVLQLINGNLLPEGGQLAVGTDGAFFFDPLDDFQGLGTGDTASISFSYTISDGDLTSTGMVEITVNGVNDAPVIDAAGPFNVLENTTDVGTIVASDVDSPTLSFGIIGGDDQALFSINSATGELTFITAPDFEVPGDDDGDNTYEVQIEVTDGEDATDTFVFIDVLDENEGGGLNDVIGTNGSDRLVGTEGDDRIDGLGGRLDVLTGLGGADVFDISSSSDNGSREVRRITDFDHLEGDLLDIGDAMISNVRATSAGTYLFLDGDRDVIILQGVSNWDTDYLL